jgi:PhnB protein
MTESKVKTREGMHTITPHIVVSDAAGAADWDKRVLGAEELGRIEVPERGPSGPALRSGSI